MISDGRAAIIAEAQPSSSEADEHDVKRQRTSLQRCSDASDITTVGPAHTADRPAAGKKVAGAEQQKQELPGSRSGRDADAAIDQSQRSPSLQPAADCRAMQPRAFYGPPYRSPGRKRGRIDGSRQTAVELRIQRFLQGVKWRIMPSAPYKTFPQQAAAFEFADTHAGDHDLRIFSVEMGSKGARQFIATTYQEFWARYRRLDSMRHYYEIVREGWPCHLYFDLEFVPEVNAGLNGDFLVDTLLADIAAGLRQHFDISFKVANVLELDSSTPQKFSRHLVVTLPGAAFASNRDVAAFAAQLLGEDPLAGPYAVAKDAAGTRACFVDTSVYSRNRAFRLYLSSKAGKTAVLQPTGRLRPATAPQRDTFMTSLICNVPPSALLLRCSVPEGGSPPAWQRVRQQLPSGRHSSTRGSSLQARPPPSPVPGVDAFLATVCNQGGTQGYVRSWTMVDRSVYLYSIGGNRWCGNIGRQHKSNGIYIVVDFSAGVWWQKCFDPDCWTYRSETMPLPQGLAPPLQPSAHSPSYSTSEGVFTQDQWASDDEAALAAADEAEADHTSLCALLEWEATTSSAVQLTADATPLYCTG